jgi:hypothetical protein
VVYAVEGAVPVDAAVEDTCTHCPRYPEAVKSLSRALSFVSSRNWRNARSECTVHAMNLHNCFNNLAGYPHPESRRDGALVSLKISLEIATRIKFEVNVVHSLASSQTIRDMCVLAEKVIYGSFSRSFECYLCRYPLVLFE